MSEHLSEQSEPKPTIAEIRASLVDKADGLGLGIDPGIMETVVGMQANGFNTRQSCEGHLDRGSAYPWVAVSQPEPVGMAEDDSGLLKGQWVEANRRLHPSMNGLLAEFYANRPAHNETRIGYGIMADSQEMEVMPMPRPKSEEKTAESLAGYRSEMDAFATFLIQKAEATNS